MASRKRPPGPRHNLSTVQAYRHNMLEFFHQCTRDYGDISLVKFPGTRIYLVNDPDLIKQTLLDHHSKTRKPWNIRQMKFALGKGLLLSEGEFWRKQRRHLHPAFHNSQIRRYADSMVAQTETMLAGWQDGDTVDLHRELSGLTLRIVAETLFGLKLDEHVQMVGEVMDLSQYEFERQMTSWLPFPLHWPLPRYWRLHRETNKLRRLVEEIMAARRAGDCDGSDLLSWLLASRAEHGMSEELMRDEIITLLTAGHETTASAMSWTLMLLAQHPEAAGRLKAEVDNVLKGRQPGFEGLAQLPYTKHVIQESMRLYPPAWALGRSVLEPFDLGGYRVPRGAFVVLMSYSVQRDARYYSEPELFRPERWSEDTPPPKHAFLPFGTGPRFCIGSNFAMTEATLILAMLAQRVDWQLLPGQSLEGLASFNLRPKDGIHALVRQRQAAGATLKGEAAKQELEPTV